jgi:hypothetical protein
MPARPIPVSALIPLSNRKRSGYNVFVDPYAGTDFAVGIDFVSRQLAEGSFYKGKSLDQKLFTYNPRVAYPEEVKWIYLDDTKVTDKGHKPCLVLLCPFPVQA